MEKIRFNDIKSIEGSVHVNLKNNHEIILDGTDISTLIQKVDELTNFTRELINNDPIEVHL